MASTRPLARRTALALLFVVSLAAHAPLAQKARDCTVRLTLLQVNDVYQFMPVERGAWGGVARRVYNSDLTARPDCGADARRRTT